MDALLIVGAAILGFLIVVGVTLFLTGHSLSESRKFVIAAAGLAGTVAALFVSDLDPNFIQAFATLAGAVYLVIGVFAATNHTPGEVQKALEALKSAVSALAGFYLTIPSGTETKVGAAIAAAVVVYGIWRVRNDGQPGTGRVAINA